MPRSSEMAEACGWVGAVMVPAEDVADRAAVGDDIALECQAPRSVCCSRKSLAQAGSPLIAL